MVMDVILTSKILHIAPLINTPDKRLSTIAKKILQNAGDCDYDISWIQQLYKTFFLTVHVQLCAVILLC